MAQRAPDKLVAASGLKHLIPQGGQSLPGRMLRKAHIGDGVEFLKSDGPAGLEQREHFGQQRTLAVCRQVDQHEALMYEVVRSLLQACVQSVCVDYFHVPQTPPAQLRACHLRETCLSLDSNYGAIGTDAF